MQKFDKEKCIRPAAKFKALGHPVRLWIARQLVEEEHCVHEFVQMTEFDFSTISQHLTILKNADVIIDEKRGKQVFYSLKCDCVRSFLRCIEENQRRKCSNNNNETEKA